MNQALRQVLILITTFALISSQTTSNGETMLSEFQKFLKQYRVSYSTNDDFNRLFTVYQENYQIVHANKNTGYTLELNKYATMTKAQFKSTFLTIDPQDLVSLQGSFLSSASPTTNSNISLKAAPSTYDWRNHGAVTGVKDQGTCGCCWAFSTAAIIEGAYAIKYGQAIQFSEQQLLSCDSSNNGCNGGNMINGLGYIQNAGGIARSSAISYVGSRQQCTFTSSLAVARVSGSKQINGDAASIKQALVNYGPLGAAVDSTNLQFYSNGIYTCSGNVNVNHAITIIGYGADSQGTYWIIKNSWGTNWGMNGYFYLREGQCGINTYIVAGTVA